MQALPQIPGAPLIGSDAEAVNLDGTVISGSTIAADGRSHAVRWAQGAAQDLGVLPGAFFSIGYGMSDDGWVIAGSSYGGVIPETAVVWTAADGMRTLSAILELHGVQPPLGYRLEQVRAVSGDGMTFAGVARNLGTNLREGFVATIPSPTLSALILAPMLFRRRRAS
jgi:probable HAF family extracellular repeat protein